MGASTAAAMSTMSPMNAVTGIIGVGSALISNSKTSKMEKEH